MVPAVVLPVLDEAAALPWVLGRMPAGYDPVVVDNGSTDGSGALAADLGARVVYEPIRGFGAACFAGLQAAQPADGIVCFMDCDASLDPEDLPRVSAAVVAGDADLCVGRRVPEPGSWPRHARWANAVLAAEVRRRTGLAVRDLGPMRAARRAVLVDLDLNDRRSGWPLEMVLKAALAGFRVEAVDVPYRPRAGRSKVTGTVGGTLRAVRDMGALLR